MCLVVRRKCLKRERCERKLEKREVDEKKSRFEILSGIREKEEK